MKHVSDFPVKLELIKGTMLKVINRIERINIEKLAEAVADDLDISREDREYFDAVVQMENDLRDYCLEQDEEMRCHSYPTLTVDFAEKLKWEKAEYEHKQKIQAVDE